MRSAESGRPGAAFVSLPMDIMMAPSQCDVLTPPAFSAAGPADSAAIKEAARLINQAKRPVVLLGLLASRPENAAAAHELIDSGKLPVVGTFQAAGAISVDLFNNFGGRVGQINNQPADEILAAGDLVITIGYDPVDTGLPSGIKEISAPLCILMFFQQTLTTRTARRSS
jgi:acetolactate synthase I/II/III large subunit